MGNKARLMMLRQSIARQAAVRNGKEWRVAAWHCKVRISKERQGTVQVALAV